MAYRVILSPAAERQISRIRGVGRLALRGVIRSLATDPRPPGALKIAGLRNQWRVRVRVDDQSWRIIYRIDVRRNEIVIARVAMRDERTYRSLR
jgi:mRNA interferase RelE/StbE